MSSADMSLNVSTNGSSSSVRLTYTCLYSIVFVAGLLLNCLALWVFFQIRSQRRTFMLYLRNMAVADLLMSLTLLMSAMRIAGVGPNWLPAIACRYTSVLFYCCMYANLLFLGLVALDRYLNIVQPFRGKWGTCFYSNFFTMAMVMVVWTVMITLSLPNTILTNQNVTAETVSKCMKLKDSLGIQWHGIVLYINIGMFFLILVTLLSCYISIYCHIRKTSSMFILEAETSRRNARQGQNILVLLVVFSICFVPYHLCRIPLTISQVKEPIKSINPVIINLKDATLFLTCCNVVLDPIIYVFMCKSFRTKLVRLLRFWTPRESPYLHTNNTNKKKIIVMRFKEDSASI